MNHYRSEGTIARHLLYALLNRYSTFNQLDKSSDSHPDLAIEIV